MSGIHNKTDRHSLAEVTRDPKETLAFIRRALDALAGADGIDEVKRIHDQAETIRAYARTAMMGLELLNGLAEIKLTAEREAGRLLRDLRLRGGRHPLRSPSSARRLRELGLTPRQSMRWQQAASVAEGRFQKYVADCKQRGREITTAGLLRFAVQHPAPSGPPCRPNLGWLSERLAGIMRLPERYPCICVSPPWPVLAAGDRRASRAMRSFIDALSELPVGDVSAPHAHLHLLAPSDALPDALTLLRCWGFTYRGAIVCHRGKLRFGPYWNTSGDFLLLGVRGNLPFRNSSPHDWFATQAQRNGDQEPPITDLIEGVSPQPRLELFGAKPRPGWKVLSEKEDRGR